MEEEQLIFQEDEVVWAKIRGYPWWPAYISELHPLGNKEYDYTVVFFGDNTNSRVDGFKVRKFIENYIECYVKAKTHRKLMSSITMAEEKLKQNDQNIEIFQDLRNRIREKRPRGRPRESHESASHILESQGLKNSHRESELQIYQQNEQSPVQDGVEAIKSKETKRKYQKKINNNTDDVTGRKEIEKMEIEENMDEKMVEEYDEEQSEKVKFPPKNRKKQQIQQKESPAIRKPSITREVDIIIDIRHMSEAQNNKKEDIQAEQQDGKQEEGTQKGALKKRRKKNQEKNSIQSSDIGLKGNEKEVPEGKNDPNPLPGLEKSKTDTAKVNEEPKKIKKIHRKKGSQGIEVEEPKGNANELEEDLSQQLVKMKDKGRSFSAGQEVVKGFARPVTQVRKRGRPKKVEVVPEPQSSEDFQEVQKSEPAPKKKIIRKVVPLPPPVPKQPEKPKGMSVADQAVVSGVRHLLHNRQGLIDFLSRSTITVENVKQILDMDVSQILQEGTITDQVVNLLEVLRAALLYKYFPDDIKHKKKYQKLLKKKHIEPEQEQSKELPRQKMEIRKKTLLKVKKFLSATEDNESKLQSIAQKIEDEVFGSDSWVGQKYCTIAFKVLSALKQRKETSQQILQRLQNKGYD